MRLSPQPLVAAFLLLALSNIVWAQTAVPMPLKVPENVIVERDVEYGKVGDAVLQLDVIRPKVTGTKPLPAIVWIHGGGWEAGNKASGTNRIAPLVASGEFVGFSIAYRFSSQAHWPAQIHDCKAAIRWIRANAAKYNIAPDRIGVWGVSAGGHLVSMLGTSGDVKELEGENGSADHSSRVRCVVDFCGPSDFPAFAVAVPPLNFGVTPVSKLLGGLVNEKPDVAKEASPITYVTKDDPPFLIVHGTRDPLVPFSQAERFHAALKQAGVSSTFVRIEEGGHGIGGPEVNRRVVAFLQKQLLGKDVEISADPIVLAAGK